MLFAVETEQETDELRIGFPRLGGCLVAPTGSTAPPGHCFCQGVKIAGLFLLYIILVHNARFMNHE